MRLAQNGCERKPANEPNQHDRFGPLIRGPAEIQRASILGGAWVLLIRRLRRDLRVVQ